MWMKASADEQQRVGELNQCAVRMYSPVRLRALTVDLKAVLV